MAQIARIKWQIKKLDGSQQKGEIIADNIDMVYQQHSDIIFIKRKKNGKP